MTTTWDQLLKFAPAIHSSGLRQALRHASIFAAVMCLTVTLGARSGYADDVDIVVEAFAIGGVAAGVSIGQPEKELVKSLVRCGMQSKSVLDCARDELIKRLPQDAQPLARCLVGGGTVPQCAQSVVVSRLPPQVQGLAQCIAQGAAVAQCGRQFATDQLSQAERTALNQAFATIEKLKIDAVARNPLTDTPGSIQNIIKIAEGSRDGDWGKVALYGGTEVYKIAGKTLLRIFLPAPLAAALDPAVDALVQHRVDLFVNILKAAEAKDERRLGELAVEAFLTLNLPLVQACALIPAGAFKELTCGNLGVLLREAAGLGGDVVALGVDAGRDIATALGLPGQDIFGTDPKCGTPASYFANNFAVCYKHASFLRSTNPNRFHEVVNALNLRCRSHFQPCNTRLVGSTSDALDEVCNPLTAKFNEGVDQLGAGLNEAALAFAKVSIPWGQSCDASAVRGKYVPDCVRALQAQFPWLQGGQEARCGDARWNLPRPDVAEAACNASFDARAAKCDACRHYTLAALNDVRIAADKGCAFPPAGRWSPDGNAHFQFCMATNDEAVVRSERDARASTAHRCDACRHYTLAALNDVRIAADKGCAFPPTGRWSPDSNAHFQFCMATNDEAVVRSERDARASTAAACVAPLPLYRPPPDIASSGPPASAGPLFLPQPPPAVVLNPERPPTAIHSFPRIDPPPAVAVRPPGPAPVSPLPPTSLIAAPPTPMPCRDGMVPNAGGGCDCPAGSVFRYGRCIPDIAKAPIQARCPDGMVPKAGGGCDCPPGSAYRFGRCILEVVRPPVQPQCRNGMVPKAGGGCDCPAGSAFRFGRCILDIARAPAQPLCRDGMVPKAGGGCGCPPGRVFRYGHCIPDTARAPSVCPPGTLLRFGRCMPDASRVVAPRPPPPTQRCRPGEVLDSRGFCGPR